MLGVIEHFVISYFCHYAECHNADRHGASVRRCTRNKNLLNLEDSKLQTSMYLKYRPQAGLIILGHLIKNEIVCRVTAKQSLKSTQIINVA